MLQGDRMEAVFTVDRSYVGNPNNESYMVIYTDQSGLDKTTTILSPSKLMTKSLGWLIMVKKTPSFRTPLGRGQPLCGGLEWCQNREQLLQACLSGCD